MVTARPRITVVIPTCNRVDLVPGAIESALAQSDPADEVIVVDDGSTDETASVVAAVPGVRLIRKENGGLSTARNAGILAARMPWIALLDDDDRYARGFLAAVRARLAERSDADVVYSAAWKVHPDGERIARTHRGHRRPADPLSALARENFVLSSAVVARRDVLIAAGLYDPDVRLCEDLDLWLRVAGMGARFEYIDRPLSSVTRHPDAMSASGVRMAEAAYGVMAKRSIALAAPEERRAWLAGARCRLGRAMRAAGRAGEARACFEEAARIDPRHWRARLLALESRWRWLSAIACAARLAKHLAWRLLARARLVEARWG